MEILDFGKGCFKTEKIMLDHLIKLNKNNPIIHFLIIGESGIAHSASSSFSMNSRIEDKYLRIIPGRRIWTKDVKTALSGKEHDYYVFPCGFLKYEMGCDFSFVAIS